MPPALGRPVRRRPARGLTERAAKSDTPDQDSAKIECDDGAIAEAAVESYRARVEMAEVNGEEFDADQR